MREFGQNNFRFEDVNKNKCPSPDSSGILLRRSLLRLFALLGWRKRYSG